jgi:hypothetical protein
MITRVYHTRIYTYREREREIYVTLEREIHTCSEGGRESK